MILKNKNEILINKTHITSNIIWIIFSFTVCLGGHRLGFGTFHDPGPGFMPFLSGLCLGLLALVDLIHGVIRKWKTERVDEEIWGGIDWRKVILTFAVLITYTISLSRLGFFLGTTLLLIFLIRMMRPRPWWVILLISGITTSLFYLVFEIFLGIPFPGGFLGF